MSRVQLHFDEPTLTKQCFKDECDVNVIMSRFKKVGGQDFLSTYSAASGGQFGDFSGVVDYRTAIDQISAAEASFMRLPARVREEFHNDPSSFLDFCGNPANADTLVKWGLASPKPTVSDVPKTDVSTTAK